MNDAYQDNVARVKALIEQVLSPGTLSPIGQEVATAYLTCDELEKYYFHYSTHRETSPPVLRGLIETALVNLSREIGGAKLLIVPNQGNTSTHNELVLAGRIVISAARCHPWTLKPTLVDFRRAGSVRNGSALFPHFCSVPNVDDGGMIHGYLEHLPGASMASKPQIMRIHFPTPDFMGEITTIDLKPYFLAALKTGKTQAPEIEEFHDLSVLEEQRTN